MTHKQKIIEECQARIEADSVAYVAAVAKDTGWRPEITDSEAESIAFALTESGKYRMEKHPQRGIGISKNPNYELSENVKKTNESIQDLNEIILPKNFKSQNIQGWWSLGLAALSVIFIFGSIILQWNDTTSKELRDIKQQLQMTSNRLDSMLISHKGMDSSLRELNDSLPVYLKRK